MEEPLEIFYASTQENSIDGTDGFGIRYKDQLIPEILIESIRVRRLFNYESGKKSLSSVVELSQEPSIIYVHKPVYTLYYEYLDGAKYLIISRNIYLGRDYGWYLDKKEDNARAGNTFAHILIFPSQDNLDGEDISQCFSKFRPWDRTNNSKNDELRALLTGSPLKLSPEYLLTGAVENKTILTQNEEDKHLLLVYYFLKSLERKTIVVLECPHEDAVIAILGLCNILPKILLTDMSYQIGFQEYGFSDKYQIVSLDRNYRGQKPSVENHYLLLNFYNEISSEIVGCDLLSIFQEMQKNKNALISFFQFVGSTLKTNQSNISWKVFCDGWICFGDGESYFDKSKKINSRNLIGVLMTYPLKESFKKRIKERVKQQTIAVIENSNFTAYKEEFFQIIVDFDIDQSEEFKLLRSQFTGMISASVEEFAQSGEQFIKKTFNWLDSSLSDTYIEWLTNEKLKFPFFSRETANFIAKHEIFSENENQLIMYCVQMKLDKALIKIIHQKQFSSNIDTRKHDFFPEIENMEIFNKYFQKETEEYLYQELIEKDLEHAINTVNCFFHKRNHLRKFYLIQILNRNGSKEFQNNKKLINWLRFVKKDQLETSLDRRIFESVLNQTIYSIQSLDVEDIMNFKFLENTLESSKKEISGILRIYKWISDETASLANAPIDLNFQPIEKFRILMMNSTRSIWNNTKSNEMKAVLSMIFPKEFFNSENKRARLVREGFWRKFKARETQLQLEDLSCLLEGFFLFSNEKGHDKKKKQKTAFQLVKVLRKIGYSDLVISVINLTQNQELKNWLIKNNSNLLKRLVYKITKRQNFKKNE